MDIGNALRKKGREDITIRATIANTVKEFYPHSFNIVSVKIHGNTVSIKTGKVLLNSELQLLQEEIKKASLQKLKKMWIILSDDIRLRFN